MKNYIPKHHHRKSIRLKEYDYSNPNWYYVTICTNNHHCIFGKVKNGRMVLNRIGKIVDDEWLRTKKIRENIDLDYYVTMPNHIHGIIIIERRGELYSPQTENQGRMRYAPTDKFKSPSQSLGSIIRGFKSSVTKRINEMSGSTIFPVWQRNYYDHIIRNEQDLHRIRKYIQNNPLKWELDEYYN